MADEPIVYKPKSGIGFFVTERRKGDRGWTYDVQWCGKGESKATLTVHDLFTLKFHPEKHWNAETTRICLGSLYPDAAAGVALAYTVAIKRQASEHRKRVRTSNKQSNIDALLKDHGWTVDLNRRDTIRHLKGCKWRKRKGGGVEIWHDGKWKHLCRTDLKDDVRTWTSWSSDGTENHFDHYRKTVAFGARITADSFYIVDALSDG